MQIKMFLLQNIVGELINLDSRCSQMEQFYQIITNEITNYLYPTDKNNLYLVNKELYGKMKDTTPTLRAVELKRRMQEELRKCTKELFYRFNNEWFEEDNKWKSKIFRVRATNERERFNSEKERVYYITCSKPTRGCYQILLKDEQVPYMWTITI